MASGCAEEKRDNLEGRLVHRSLFRDTHCVYICLNKHEERKKLSRTPEELDTIRTRRGSHEPDAGVF